VFICFASAAQSASFLEVLRSSEYVAGTDSESKHSYIHYGEVALLDSKNQGDISNIGVLIGQRSVAIIDSGGSPQVAEKLLSAIANISVLPISHIIITHAHPDHWMGLPTLLEKTEAQLLVSHAFVNALARRIEQDRSMLFEALGEGITEVNALSQFSLDKYAHRINEISDSVMINLGNRAIRLDALPVSHTDNDLLVWDEINQTLWAGDLFFVEHVPTYEASLKGLQTSRNMIDEYSASLIVSGHGHSQPNWQDKWQKQWQYFDALMKSVRLQISEGNSLQSALAQAEQTVKAERTSSQAAVFADWQLMESFHPRNVTRAFQALEWE
jgi:quinoprotein relay system zinc metallohydrolase 2